MTREVESTDVAVAAVAVLATADVAWMASKLTPKLMPKNDSGGGNTKQFARRGTGETARVEVMKALSDVTVRGVTERMVPWNPGRQGARVTCQEVC